jgi:hypothetical protein
MDLTNIRALEIHEYEYGSPIFMDSVRFVGTELMPTLYRPESFSADIS